eukprot:14060387-Ditylum_brightwellii.AAC.1
MGGTIAVSSFKTWNMQSLFASFAICLLRSEVSLVWCTCGRAVVVEEKKQWLVMSCHGGSGGLGREPIP